MPKPWSKSLARDHLTKLAANEGIAIRWVSGRNWIHDSEASEVARLVHIPRPHNAYQYLVALHEIGHILGDIGYQDRERYHHWSTGTFQLACEAAAWAWAMDHIHTMLDTRVLKRHFTATVGVSFETHCWRLAEIATQG